MKILIFFDKGLDKTELNIEDEVFLKNVRAWVQSGHKIAIFCKDSKTSTSPLKGVEVISRGKKDFAIRIAAYFWYKFGNNQKFDLVIDRFSSTPFYTPVFVKENLVASVATDFFLENNLDDIKHQLFLRTIGNKSFVFRNVYSNLDFLVNNSFVQERLNKFGINSKKVRLLPYGLVNKKSSNKIYKTAAGFADKYYEEKDIESLLTVFSTLFRKDVGWKFQVITVNKKVQNKIKVLGKNVGINLKIDIVRNEKELSKLFNKIGVFVHTIDYFPNYVLINALNCGVPIATNISTSRSELLDSKHTILTKSKDPQSLALEIIKAFSNEKTVQQKKKTAQKFAQKYNFNYMREESNSIIESI